MKKGSWKKWGIGAACLLVAVLALQSAKGGLFLRPQDFSGKQEVKQEVQMAEPSSGDRTEETSETGLFADERFRDETVLLEILKRLKDAERAGEGDKVEGVQGYDPSDNAWYESNEGYEDHAGREGDDGYKENDRHEGIEDEEWYEGGRKNEEKFGEVRYEVASEEVRYERGYEEKEAHEAGGYENFEEEDD